MAPGRHRGSGGLNHTHVVGKRREFNQHYLKWYRNARETSNNHLAAVKGLANKEITIFVEKVVIPRQVLGR